MKLISVGRMHVALHGLGRYHRAMNITKRMVREALKGKNGDPARDIDVARFFGVTPGAVAQWGDDDPLPEARQWQAMAMKPRLFKAPKAA